MDISLLGLLLEIDISNTVNDENLAVLRNGPLLGTNRSARQLCLDGSADARRLDLVGEFGSLCGVLSSTTGLLVTSSLLASVPVHSHRLFLLSSCGWWGCGAVGAQAWDTTNAALITPSSASGVSDVAFDKLALLFPAKVQSDVVGTASNDDEQTEQHRTETRSEALVVVAGSSPCWEAVVEEVVVAFAFGAAQDVGDYS